MCGATRKTLLVLAVLAGGLAWGPAGAAPAAGASPSSRAYATELEAVMAAVALVNARSIREDREYLGAIVRRAGRFHFSVAPGEPGADRIRVRLSVPDGDELVALWHTHGAAAPERRFYSPTDVALVARTGKPLYLADFNGALRVLRPGAPTLSAPEARRRGLGLRAGAAAGERVRAPGGEPVLIPTRTVPVLAVNVSY